MTEETAAKKARLEPPKLCLIIGNGNRRLTEAEENASSVSEAFKAMGYQTRTCLNKTVEEMIVQFTTLRCEVKRRSTQEGMCVFYFSGHCRKVNGDIMLTGGDNRDFDLEYFRSKMEQSQGKMVFGCILDCCYTRGRKPEIYDCISFNPMDEQFLICGHCDVESFADKGCSQFTNHMCAAMKDSKDVVQVFRRIVCAVVKEKQPNSQLPVYIESIRTHPLVF